MSDFKFNRVIQGDCLEKLKEIPDESIDCCVTSPPYFGLRDYGTGKWIGGDPNCPHKRMNKVTDSTITGHANPDLQGNVADSIYKTVCPLCGAVREDLQIGLEETPEDYVQKLVRVFNEVHRVLKKEGTLWLNIGDSYWGSGSRGCNFTGKFTEASAVQAGSKGSENLSNIPRCSGATETGLKNKDMIGIPWMLAFALRSAGWYLRQDIIWSKVNPMPESVTDRCTKSHEYIFLLSKSPKYYFDHEAIQEPANIQKPSEHVKFGGNKYGSQEDTMFAIYSGNEYQPRTKNCQYDGQKPNTMHIKREMGMKDEEYLVRNKRDVWSVSPSAFKGAHFATFPEDLIKPCILAGCPEQGVVLDPFFGSGTTGKVATKYNRNYLGIELNPEYIEISNKRISGTQLMMFDI